MKLSVSIIKTVAHNTKYKILLFQRRFHSICESKNKKISSTPPVLAEERKNNNMKKNGAVSVYTHCHEEQPCQIRFPKSKDYAETFRISNASPVAGTSP